jgi:hypothetical protein
MGEGAIKIGARGVFRYVYKPVKWVKCSKGWLGERLFNELRDRLGDSSQIVVK